MQCGRTRAADYGPRRGIQAPAGGVQAPARGSVVSRTAKVVPTVKLRPGYAERRTKGALRHGWPGAGRTGGFGATPGPHDTARCDMHSPTTTELPAPRARRIRPAHVLGAALALTALILIVGAPAPWPQGHAAATTVGVGAGGDAFGPAAVDGRAGRHRHLELGRRPAQRDVHVGRARSTPARRPRGRSRIPSTKPARSSTSACGTRA